MVEVLYEDNHLIAVNKPAGLLTQGDDSGDPNLLDEVKKHIKIKHNKPGNVFLGLIHRLDRNVSGVILFAKTSKGASRLSEQFREHTVEKKYTALVEGLIIKDGGLKHYIAKNKETNKSVISEKEFPDSKEAHLYYKVLKNYQNSTLLEITLGTGRSHQIRAQLSHIGHPIYGDYKYGASTKMANHEIALAATSLKFRTASTSEDIYIKIDIPKSWKF